VVASDSNFQRRHSNNNSASIAAGERTILSAAPSPVSRESKCNANI
jgi:hypothetical protein